MASLMQLPGGRWRIQFQGADGKRHSLRPGRLNMKAAERLKGIVEALVTAAFRAEDVDEPTHKTIQKLPDKIYKKMVRLGLVEPRAVTIPTLGAFIDSYIAGRTDIKEGTRTAAQFDAASLLEYFGRDKRLRSITVGDAKAFAIALKAKGLAGATIGRRIIRAKEFFNAAVDRELIGKNPFRTIKPPSQKNEARKRFITREQTDKLLAACPNWEWRLIVALSRYGGLRCPSETLALTWADVDMVRKRITIRSSKTEHHEGGGSREIPVFPELVEPLKDALEADESGTYVISHYRDTRANLRTQLLRIIKRAGLTPWPKTFHNLRASRETELADSFPLHVVCAWIGNSERIAAGHYLQTTDAHFEKAALEVAHATPRLSTDEDGEAALDGEDCRLSNGELVGAVSSGEGKLPGLDLNQDKQNQNLLCYRYTTG